MSIKHDKCEAWETEIARLREELAKAHRVIVGLCDMTVDVIHSLKAMDDRVEVEASLKNINKLKEKYKAFDYQSGLPL